MTCVRIQDDILDSERRKVVLQKSICVYSFLYACGHYFDYSKNSRKLLCSIISYWVEQNLIQNIFLDSQTVPKNKITDKEMIIYSTTEQHLYAEI